MSSDIIGKTKRALQSISETKQTICVSQQMSCKERSVVQSRAYICIKLQETGLVKEGKGLLLAGLITFKSKTTSQKITETIYKFIVVTASLRSRTFLLLFEKSKK